MNRRALEHIIRAAAEITGEREFVVIGSQAVLGQYPNAPDPLLISNEADIHPVHAPDKALDIEGAIGQGSPFDETFRYHADGIERGLPPLPEGWRQRLVSVCNANTNWATGLCLEVHDIAAAKYAAMREKDLRYTRDLWEHGMLDPDILDERIRTIRIDPPEKRPHVERAARQQRKLHDTGRRPRPAQASAGPSRGQQAIATAAKLKQQRESEQHQSEQSNTRSTNRSDWWSR